MLIISDFHDYYDSVASQGVDKSIIYNRKEIEFDYKDNIFNWWNYKFSFSREKSRLYNKKTETEFKTFIIGFCGKLYLCIIENTLTGNKVYYYDDSIQFLIENNVDNLYRFNNKKSKLSSAINNWWSEMQIKLEYTFQEYKTPIFIIGNFGTNYDNKIKIKINTKLSEHLFYRMKDSYMSFQEIQSYISGVLGNSENIDLKLTDKEKILQHGMDTKWSFRNPNPPKRKIK